MSSTTRTRIWSAISLWLVLDRFGRVAWSGVSGERDGRRILRSHAPVAPLVVPSAAGPPAAAGYLLVAVGVTVWTTSGGRTPYESTSTLRVTPVVTAETGGRTAPVSGSTKSPAARRARVTLPSIWANLRTSDCWAVTATITISCWPLRFVPGPDGAPVPGSPEATGTGVAAAVSAGGGGRSVPITWRPWSSSLTLVLLRPATTVIALSPGATVMTGNLSAVRPTTMST